MINHLDMTLTSIPAPSQPVSGTGALVARAVHLLVFLVAIVCQQSQAMAQEPPESQHVLVTREMLEAALDLPCPEVSLLRTPDRKKLSLAVCLDYLSNLMSDAAGFPVYLLPDRAELELDGISDLNDIEMRPLKIPAGTHTFRDVLSIMPQHELERDPELRLLPRERYILLTTAIAAELDENMESHVYDIADLLKTLRTDGPPEGLRTGPVGASTADLFIQTVHDMTSPRTRWFDIDGEGGRISKFGDSMVIRQDYFTLQTIQQLLTKLRHPVSLDSQQPRFAPRRGNGSTLNTRDMIERVWNLPSPIFQLGNQGGPRPDADQFLKLMERHMSEAAGFPVSIRVDWPELDIDGVRSLREISMRPILVASTTSSFGEVLGFAATNCLGSRPIFGFIPRERDILFSTRTAFEWDENLEIAVYDVEQLLKRLDATTRQRLSNSIRIINVDNSSGLDAGSGARTFLIHLIQDYGRAGSRWFDINGEGGRISIFGSKLVIRQTWSAQQSIRRLLQQLNVVTQTD
jgi:hypothetical protein